jgi:hypothetical protein
MELPDFEPRAGCQQGHGQPVWESHHLQPHRTRTFKLSRDVRFMEKMTDVVGLYLNPPEKALVLCVDEKSQIQALDRTQPGLPMKKGRCGNTSCLPCSVARATRCPGSREPLSREQEVAPTTPPQTHRASHGEALYFDRSRKWLR